MGHNRFSDKLHAEKKQRQAAFLLALRGQDKGTPLSVRSACTVSGVTRTAVYHWLSSDIDFLELYNSAMEDGTDLLEDVANERAIKGMVVERKMDDDGNIVSEKIDHDNGLLRFLLQGRRPARYRANQDVNVGVNVNNQLDDNQVARALALLMAEAKRVA